MNLTQDSLGLFSVLAYLGEDFDLNVMVMLRDILMHRGNLPPLPGGDIAEDRMSNLKGENAHPFPTAEEIETLTDPKKLQEAIAHSPTAQFMKEFSAMVGNSKQTDIQFLDNSNRDRFMTLAWKTQAGDWILLAKNLKPRNGQPLYLDFIEFPEKAVQAAERRLQEWRVLDPFTGQYAQAVREFHENKPYYRIKGNLAFLDRDYKFLILKKAANVKVQPIPPALNLQSSGYDLRMRELHQRSEIRNLNEVASSLLDSLAGIRKLSDKTTEEIVRRSELRFDDLIDAVKSEAQKPWYVLTQNPDGAEGVRLYQAYASGVQFQKKHPDYDKQFRKFILRAVEAVYHQSKIYLETDANNRLNFAFGFSADSEETRTPLMQYLRMIQGLKKKFPSRVEGNVRIFVSSSDLKNPVLQKFFREIGKSGVAKVIELNGLLTSFKIQDYLQKHKNALIYNVPESELGPYQNRLVRSQVTPKAAFPVAAILSARLAQTTEITAEALKKVPVFLPEGIVGYDGKSLIISALAYQLAYDIQTSRRLAIMA